MLFGLYRRPLVLWKWGNMTLFKPTSASRRFTTGKKWPHERKKSMMPSWNPDKWTLWSVFNGACYNCSPFGILSLWYFRTMDLGPFAGPIYTAILLVDCLFFLFLEWWMPREDLHFVRHHWNPEVFTEVCHCHCIYTLSLCSDFWWACGKRETDYREAYRIRADAGRNLGTDLSTRYVSCYELLTE